MMSGYDFGSCLGFGMGFGWILPLLVLGLVLWAIVAFTRSQGGRGATAGTAPDDALGLLKERYARGEVDAETYQRMREELQR